RPSRWSCSCPRSRRASTSSAARRSSSATTARSAASRPLEVAPMSVMKRPLRAFVAFTLLCGGLATGLPAARAEEPVKLDGLAPDTGARFGDWTVWNITGDSKAVFFIHEKTRQVIYLTWASNGWVYFRDGKGAWHTVYSQGDPVQENQA